MTPSRALVLNVDDNNSKRYVKTRVLTRAGFDVVEARTAAAARALVAERRPDLVLLDVKLPDGDGRELSAWIKSNASAAPPVVLQISAFMVEAKDRVASLDAGADGYLSEPVDPSELVANVRALLRLRQAERERQAAITALQEADRRKDEFLAMLAHELRNPLAPIRNAVEILRSGDEALRERARTIVGRQVDHLARLVDDLLEVSRITQRKVVLKRGVATLRTIVDTAVETARPFVEANGHELSVSVPAADLWLNVDAVRMAQAIGNLLHNACKFTPRGGKVALSAAVVRDVLEIQVSDNGVGIAPEMLPLVFDLFTQDERSLARSQGGLGIGLSLVRGMVDMHGGSVSAASDGRNLGSRFTIRLPLARNAASGPRPAAPQCAGAQERRRILVVEDNADTAETLGIVLEHSGHEVTVVTDGLKAIEAARAARPDVVLLDIGLPGIDGYELAVRLRGAPETRSACLIAVSGYGQESDRERSAAAGFDFHLTKPVEPARLAAAIDSCATETQ